MTYLVELVAGTLLALLVVYLVSLFYGFLTKKNLIGFPDSEERLLSDVKDSFHLAQRVFWAIENFQARIQEQNMY